MSDQVFWANYLFFCDFTEDKDSLVDLPLGKVDDHAATILAAALSVHDLGNGRALWTDQANPEWGVAGAEIIYNGVNQTGFASNGMYDHVLLLKFPSTQVSPQGVIALQYNMGTTAAPVPPTEPAADPAAESTA